MYNFNRVILMGNLTSDPKALVFDKGRSKTVFTIAINRNFKKDNGEDGNEVAFIDCEAWGGLGNTIKKFFGKGRPIMIEGRLRQYNREKDGRKESKVIVLIEKFEFLDSASKNNKTQEAESDYNEIGDYDNNSDNSDIIAGASGENLNDFDSLKF